MLESRPALRCILGTMTFAGQTSLEDATLMVERFVSRGHAELDTARMYEKGATEALLGRMFEAQPRLREATAVASKVNPFNTHDRSLSAASVRAQLGASLHALGAAALPVLYLHAPDALTPIGETLDAVAEAHAAGKFVELGLSNYAAWEVAHIHALCRERGMVTPTIYQGARSALARRRGGRLRRAAAAPGDTGRWRAPPHARRPRGAGMYNAITRDVERELLPCLRALGMRFYAYNPLAGGLLTGKHDRAGLASATEGRFRASNALYRGRYLADAQLEATEGVCAACAEHGITPTAAALRWLRHHSALRPADGVIVGASRPGHFDANMAALEDEQPLPDAVVEAMDAGWQRVRTAGCVPSYERGHSKYEEPPDSPP